VPILLILKTIAAKLGLSRRAEAKPQSGCGSSIHDPANGRYDSDYPRTHQTLMLVVAGSVST
jgi:hypothetical protein